MIRSGSPCRQLSFDPDSGTLFAQEFGGSHWYTVNLCSGSDRSSITPIAGFNSAVVGNNGLRDLGDALLISILVPGPLQLAGVVVVLAYSRKLRRRIHQSSHDSSHQSQPGAGRC